MGEIRAWALLKEIRERVTSRWAGHTGVRGDAITQHAIDL